MSAAQPSLLPAEAVDANFVAPALDVPPPAMSATYKRYVLGVMCAVYMLNLTDRALVMILLQPIKEDLRLSDTQLGLVTGIAFGLFYATLGLPIARWADRGNRVTITSIAIGLWGVTVMASTLIANFSHLVVARIAAAVGEAGCKPPTYSLVGDYFPGASERSRAMSIYLAGSPLAALLAFVVGGWLNEIAGWRMTFFVMGIPGILLALLVRATVVEPRRSGQVAEVAVEMPSTGVVLAMLWRRKTCRHLSFALILLYTMGLGMGPWYAAFMIRTHGIGTQELGLWLGLIFGFAGLGGVLAGGFVTSRWFPQREASQMRVTAITVAALVPCFVAFLTLPGRAEALSALIPLMLVFNFFLAPTYALLQRLVPDNMRATAMAIVMLLANLIGMGLGPLIVGWLSDMLLPAFGAASLRMAMLAISLIALWAAVHFWRSGRYVAEDLRAASDDRNPGLGREATSFA